MRRVLFTVLLLSLGLASCGGGTTSNSISTDPTPAPVLAPGVIVAGSELAAFTENTSTGELTAATSSPYRTHFNKACAQVPGTPFIALAQNDNTLNLYRMTPAPDPLRFDPAIRTLLPTSSASTQGFPISLAASRSLAYVSDAQSFVIRGFAIDSAAGSIRPLGSLANELALAMAIHPSGRFLYVFTNPMGLATYFIDSTGRLSLISRNSNLGTTYDRAIGFTSDGKRMVIADGMSEVHVLSVNETTGALTEVTGSPLNIKSGFLTVHPSGKYVYVADFNNGLSVLSLNPETGQPSAIQQLGIAFNAQALAVDSSGAHLYVAGYNGEFQAYSLDTSTGRIQSAIGTQLTVPDSPACVIAR